MVLLILAVIWAAVLVPPYLRSRAEARPADSIGHFRRQLATLQSTGPRAHLPLTGVFAHTPRHLPAVPVAARRSAHAMARHVRSTPRARAQRRRREVLAALLTAMGLTLALGFMPTLRIMWLVHVVFDVVFVAYVALLIRLRNLAAEREMKVRFLPGMGRVEPALLRRSAQ